MAYWPYLVTLNSQNLDLIFFPAYLLISAVNQPGSGLGGRRSLARRQMIGEFGLSLDIFARDRLEFELGRRG
jgi:hypothetical protein